MQCTIDIFKNGQWQECCTVTAENPEVGRHSPSVIRYSRDYPFDGEPAPSLRCRFASGVEELPYWPSFLLDLIPQGDGRRHLLETLNLPDEPTSDWKLLLMGAINPPGRLRVREAVEAWRGHQPDSGESGQGFSIGEILSRSDAVARHFDTPGIFAAGTTSVQGLSPKLLLTRGKDGLWYADAALPDSRAAKHYILKFSRARNLADWTILQHEAAYMRLAQEMGLFVEDLPEWKHDILFVPRFDRAVIPGGVIRYQQESLVSLADLADPAVLPTHNAMLEALRRVVSNPYEATLEYIKRDIMNLALGNTDNSPENTSVQTVNGKTRLAPLYDFAPAYLDTDEIARALEWVDENGDEITAWADVLHALPFSLVEKEALRQDLRAFGGKMEKLESLMQQHGVSEDIMTDRYYGIQNQRWQLGELQAFR